MRPVPSADRAVSHGESAQFQALLTGHGCWPPIDVICRLLLLPTGVP